METFYIYAVALLAIFAVFDLIVGVSNDAVNFLNSAIGSKVANRRIILIIATVGIVLGAMSSGGMMEVTRKGIFNPEHFYFNEIMIIFLAVMITDIILLDLFNTFGLPTSTTVSIVFEMLGASLAVSFIKTLHDNSPLNYLFNHNQPEEGIIGFMNWEKAGEIVSGILLSVVIAFTIGALVQYFSRILFSFHYEKRLKYIGAVWAGASITAMLFFLMYKGLGAMVSGVAPEDMQFYQVWFAESRTFLQANLLLSILVTLLLCSLLMLILQLYKVNILRVVVLFGTFALAMAFAGNDLVNFIGVPIAGWQSFEVWQGSGVAAEAFSMEAMSGRVATPYFLLLLAGIVMAFTLWLSKKAQSVTETEVNLGSQIETDERFNTNRLARGIVEAARTTSNTFNRVLSGRVRKRIEHNFRPLTSVRAENEGAAFDLLRASVNLSVASVLIAAATSMKLPLSTTYVSFMVAMGTSLADRAWGRESAVYRIAGVMNVIGGWFLTALMASTAAALFATLIYYGGVWMVAGLVILVFYLIYRSSKYHAVKLEKKQTTIKRSDINYKDINETLDQLSADVSSTLATLNRVLNLSIEGIHHENKAALKKSNKLLEALNEDYAMVKSGLFKIIRKNKSSETTSAHLYVLTYDMMQDILQSMGLVVEASSTHVRNNHKPLTEAQNEAIREVNLMITDFLKYLEKQVGLKNYQVVDEVNTRKKIILNKIEELMDNQIEGVMHKQYGFKNTSLYFTLMLEMKDLVAISARFIKLYARITKKGKLFYEHR
jgi:phosphate/sulfate permease